MSDTNTPKKTKLKKVKALRCLRQFPPSERAAVRSAQHAALAAIMGGYLGARLARMLPAAPTRTGIAICNFAMTAVVFWRAFL